MQFQLILVPNKTIPNLLIKQLMHVKTENIKTGHSLWFFFTCFWFYLAYTKYLLLNQLRILEKSSDRNPMSFTFSFLCVLKLIKLTQCFIPGENMLNTLAILTEIGFAFLSPWVIHCCYPHAWQQLVSNICFLTQEKMQPVI